MCASQAPSASCSCVRGGAGLCSGPGSTLHIGGGKAKEAEQLSLSSKEELLSWTCNSDLSCTSDIEAAQRALPAGEQLPGPLGSKQGSVDRAASFRKAQGTGARP